MLQPQGARNLGAAPSKLSMSDLGSSPTMEIVGRAKATLANVLSARFPEVRRIISRDLNLHDRLMMLRTCHNLRVSITSRDHLKHFSRYFRGRCDAQLPRWGEVGDDLYSDKVRHSLWGPCEEDGRYSIIKLCEGPRVLRKAACDGQRAVGEHCMTGATDLADPGGLKQCLPNFGVTPICDACFVSTNSRIRKHCRCVGLPLLAAGERHGWDLWLCFACRLAYNVEQAQFADDMARAYLYMEKNNDTNTLEYLPNAKVSSAKVPTCPCGDETLRTKITLRGSAYGMCVWCGGLKTTRFNGKSEAAKSIWEGPALPTGRRHIVDQVISKEAVIAIHNQIKQKGLPPPLPKGANQYWSYASVSDEPRLLHELLRNEYEAERRPHPDDSKRLKSDERKRLNWDDREGFLRHFRWQSRSG